MAVLRLPALERSATSTIRSSVRRRGETGVQWVYDDQMARHERIVIAFRGGPRDGARKDLGEATGGSWPAEYTAGRWPSLNEGIAGSAAAGGHYVRTDQWSPRAEARIYVWQPDTQPKDG